MRTEGSLTKAPGVVCRAVHSISWRSINRIGETVWVPIGCSLTRCGINDPGTKTVRSSTFCLRFGACLTLGSASAIPATKLIATRTATIEDIKGFTTKLTPSWVLYANCRNQGDKFFAESKRGNSWCHCLSADLTKRQ